MPNLSFGLADDPRTPMYLRIERMIEREIAAGNFRIGDKLPPVRDMAQRLSVNAVTVSRAYRELSVRGVVKGRGRSGTIVASNNVGTAAPVVARERAPQAAPLPRAGARDTVSGNKAFQQMLLASQAVHVLQLTRAYPCNVESVQPRLHAVLKEVASAKDLEIFDYSSFKGAPELRAAICDYLSARGMSTSPEMVLVTSGAQQGLDIVTRSLLRAGDTVLVEKPTYFGMIDLLRTQGARIVQVEMDSEGINADALRSAIKDHSPTLLYTVPTFHNPTGVSMSLRRRTEVLELCGRSNVAVLEDDYAPELRFRGQVLPSLWQLSAEQGSSGTSVYHVRSFSKTYMPGMRLGLVVQPARRNQVNLINGLSALHTSNLVQLFGLRFFRSGLWEAVENDLIEACTERQEVFTRTLRSALAGAASFDVPDGGLNIWLRLPEHVDASDFFFTAIRNGVSFFAGELFYADVPKRNCARLSFGGLTPDQLRNAATRLAVALDEHLNAAESRLSQVI